MSARLLSLTALLWLASAAVAQEPGEYAEARAAFERALAAQKSGDAEAAIAAYHQVLALKPDSASTYNNLAKLHQSQGNQEEALSSYQKAIAIDDENQPFYRQQYAKALASAGRNDEAYKQYEQLALEVPEATSAQRVVLDRFIADAPGSGDELVRFLWVDLRNEQALRAAESALKALQNATFEPRIQFDLVTVVGAAMSRPGVSAEQNKRLLRSLARLDNEILSRCVDELVSLNREPEGDYPWWAERGSARRDPRVGIWPRDAFRGVARTLGWRAELAGEYELAERYYRTAATLSDDELDPKAFESLVRLYAGRGQTDKLEALASDGTMLRRVFQQKGDAYRRGHLEAIYQYHVTLGYLFGNLAKQDPKWWGDSETPASAVFQLERAMAVGKQIDARTRRDDPPRGTRGSEQKEQKAHVDVGVVSLLSNYYDKNDQARSRELRLETAARLRAVNNNAHARQVLKPVPDVTIDNINKTRLRDQLQKAGESNAGPDISGRDLSDAELRRALQRQQARSLVEAARRNDPDDR